MHCFCGLAEPPAWQLRGDASMKTPPGPAARVLIGMVRAYRLLLSPWLGSQCRFEPTCSVYAMQALDTHGALGGGYLAARRILRCHPWCTGGIDEVPGAPPFPLFRRFQHKKHS